MVVIPVKMYPATESKAIHFHMLHRECLTRPKQLRFCPHCQKTLSNEEVVRGYEYLRGQFVTLEEEDLQNVPLKTRHTIDILGFVDAGEIDPLYYRGSYYLEPEELGAKPFLLFRGALLETGRLALAKVAFQGREHLCCLRPFEDTVMLHTMYYYDEVRPVTDLALPQEVAISPEEMQMAVALVQAMAKEFRPEEYEDHYRRALENIIEAKVQGQEIKGPPQPAGKVTDLMAALRASVEAARKGTLTPAEEPPAPRRRAAARSRGNPGP